MVIQAISKREKVSQPFELTNLPLERFAEMPEEMFANIGYLDGGGSVDPHLDGRVLYVMDLQRPDDPCCHS